MRITRATRPLAITMWDFSWLERRWPGAGYGDWERALDGLQERGYEAIRIDAYPHLYALDPDREWEILPCWNQQDWGSPALNRVRLRPALPAFLRLCRERNLQVSLSTWFRRDRGDTRLGLRGPADLAGIWSKTLARLRDEAPLDHVLFVDLCNEFPLPVWAPFLYGGDEAKSRRRHEPGVGEWMRAAVLDLRREHPGFDYTFSTCLLDDRDGEDTGAFDLLEPHVWLTSFTDFYARVGYGFERFDPKGYENLVLKSEALYRAEEGRWREALVAGIGAMGDWSRRTGKPLVTTECWGMVDYKDWPLLDWGWVKELCELGVGAALAEGAWAALATSNFCGPQFRGMWDDADWHRRLTGKIRAAALRIPEGGWRAGGG